MSKITERTANWRLFGGGGFVVAGLLLLLGYGSFFSVPSGLTGIYTSLVEGSLWPIYVLAAGFIVFGASFGFVAFGQTGSNGAVGNLLWGKIVLLIAGILWVLVGAQYLMPVLTRAIPQEYLLYLAVIAGVVANIAILQKDVVRGIARFALFATSLLVLVPVLVPGASMWGSLLLAAAVLVNGALYLFNGKSGT